ncbi:MAG: tRNA (adenosine(37)-N6)-threonylcarbamoyltransferase complex dimerization subunit type 1 TsaB [Solirubrobacteraceae bacterium]
MRILAFDTATRATTVAFAEVEGDGSACQVMNTLEIRDDPPPGERPRHAPQLLALVVGLLETEQMGWDAIDRIAVGLGPGTFTGLRIGVATAKGLAQAAGTPLVGVSTLHSLALNARDVAEGGEAPGTVLAVLDARRGEAFVAAWDSRRLDQHSLPILAPCALTPDALAEAVTGLSDPMAIGEGALAFRDVLERSGGYVPEDASKLHRVTARNHCLIARGLPVTQPDRLVPDYQRLPDARPRAAPPSGPERAGER